VLGKIFLMKISVSFVLFGTADGAPLFFGLDIKKSNLFKLTYS